MESQLYEHLENENARIRRDPVYPSFELMREFVRANREIDPAMKEMLVMNMKEDARHYRETVTSKTRQILRLHVLREWQILIRLIFLLAYGLAVIWFSKGQFNGYLTSSLAVMGACAFRSRINGWWLFNKKMERRNDRISKQDSISP